MEGGKGGRGSEGVERGKEVRREEGEEGGKEVERGKEVRREKRERREGRREGGRERSRINSLLLLEQLDLKYCYYTHPHIHTQPTPLELST